jgi:RNA polymerase-binding transcription factor DksA
VTDGFGNRAVEIAQVRAEQEAAAGIAAASAALTGAGANKCIDCTHEIGAARRTAMPSAERCITCQELFEKASR